MPDRWGVLAETQIRVCVITEASNKTVMLNGVGGRVLDVMELGEGRWWEGSAYIF